MSTWHNKLWEMENKSQRRTEYFVTKKKGMKHCYSLHSKQEPVPLLHICLLTHEVNLRTMSFSNTNDNEKKKVLKPATTKVKGKHFFPYRFILLQNLF